MKEIMELVGVSTAERPIKGFALDKALYVANTKQDVLDEQAISNERVANLVVWARDIEKFMVFNINGSSYEEKDFPSGSGDLSEFAKLNENVRFQAIESNHGNDTTKHGLELKQDSNRWCQMVITNNMVLWQWDDPDDVTKSAKTRFLTIAQSGFDFERSPKYLGVRLATIEELPAIYVDGNPKTISSISVGDGLTSVYDPTSKDLKLATDSSEGYDGDGFGVPGKTLVEDGTVVQTQITGNYRNNSDKGGNLTINVRTDEGVKNWRFYYNIPRGSISARKVYVKVDEKAGTNKIINSGETWQCEVKAGPFFDEFFWSQIMDSASTFITQEDTKLLIAENNLVQADLQTRFGAGTVEINNLEFTVDSITANNLNEEA